MNLSCQDLSKSFGRKQVLRGCTLNIRAGEFIGLVGENGAGKSTLVQCLLGFLRPDSGRIQLHNHIGYCPQGNILNRKYKVSEHLLLAQSIVNKKWNLDVKFLRSCLDRLKLHPYLETQVGDLSQGTYQKVKFLTAIFHSPNLLLLDEPYDGFDWQMYLVFWDIVAELKQQGSAILMISHLIYDRNKFDKIFEIHGGQLELSK